MGALTPLHLDAERVVLGVVADAARELRQALAHGLPEGLRRLLTQRLGPERQVVLAGADGAGASATAATDERGRTEAYRLAQEDPLVKELVRRFEADIISREPYPRSEFRKRYRPDS